MRVYAISGHLWVPTIVVMILNAVPFALDIVSEVPTSMVILYGVCAKNFSTLVFRNNMPLFSATSSLDWMFV